MERSSVPGYLRDAGGGGATVSPRAGRGHAGRPGAWLAAAAAVLALCGCDGTIAGTFAGDGGAPASDGPRIDMDGAIAMGFDAGPVPSSEQRPAGAIMFTDVTMQAGRGNTVSDWFPQRLGSAQGYGARCGRAEHSPLKRNLAADAPCQRC